MIPTVQLEVALCSHLGKLTVECTVLKMYSLDVCQGSINRRHLADHPPWLSCGGRTCNIPVTAPASSNGKIGRSFFAPGREDARSTPGAVLVFESL